jgi:arginine/lysine/ornithine decarboxylase
MNTPICDFVEKYTKSKSVRLHMPGHKGFGSLGVEHLDITEITGADSLYEASGIIKVENSEK